MAHQIHQTRGFIVGGFEFGEADKVLEVLTRDFGLIRARALAIREGKSKLRFVIQDGVLLDLGLVAGKHHFRIVEAQKVKDFGQLFTQSKKATVLINLLNLAKRLLSGQEKNELFFIDFLNVLNFLDQQNLSSEQLRSLEAVAVVRVLYHLGYFADDKKYDFLISDNLSPSLLAKTSRLRPAVIEKINQALSESQL